MVLDTAGRVSEEAKVQAIEGEPSPEAAEAHDASSRDPGERGELFTPERLASLRKIIPALWLLGAVAAGIYGGPPLLLLVLASGALTLVVMLMWSSVQSLTGGTALGFEEALGMGAPSRVEEQKRAVLRALKDLEYERGVGKISPEDYAELSVRYRAEAKRLMQSLDEALGPARQDVERTIQARLARAGLREPSPTATVGADSPELGPAPALVADAQPRTPEETS